MKKAINLLLSTIIIFTSTLEAKKNEDILVDNMNEFATSFYKTVEAKDICFSPYSLFSCLTMAYMGAKSTTALEMQKALHLTLSKSDLVEATSKIQNNLASPSLNIANALWVKTGLSLKNSYKNAMESGWAIGTKELEFRNQIACVNTINSWVAAQTNNQIDKLLLPGDLDPETKLVLTNAIYFKGEWRHVFKKELTEEASFYTSESKSSKVKMMQQINTFPYYEDEDLQFLVMPFTNKDNLRLASFFILPKNEGVEDFINAKSLQEILSRTQNNTVEVKIPRFKLKNRLTPRETLEKMGMKKAFCKSSDFSDISTEAQLEITKVIHEALFTCDENGVTAAAATGIVMGITSFKPDLRPSYRFLANKPFLFGIVDLDSGLILFFGKLSNPI